MEDLHGCSHIRREVDDHVCGEQSIKKILIQGYSVAALEQKRLTIPGAEQRTVQELGSEEGTTSLSFYHQLELHAPMVLLFTSEYLSHHPLPSLILLPNLLHKQNSCQRLGTHHQLYTGGGFLVPKAGKVKCVCPALQNFDCTFLKNHYSLCGLESIEFLAHLGFCFLCSVLDTKHYI